MAEFMMDHRRRDSDSDESCVSHHSLDHPPSFNRDRNRPDRKRRHQATLINQGPPALYHLNTERSYIDGTDRKIRQWTYGRRDRNKPNKVILMVGETGSGKTTIINTMINHLLGVKFQDQEFYQITEEKENKDQSQSQTRVITVYEMFVEENPTSLTIIDTPGYGHTEGLEKEREISEYLIRLFSDKDGIHYLDAVCFVMKMSQNRLSDKELYLFHSVLSLFGRDIENNLVFLLTQSDGLPPTDALNAINKAGIPCRRDERGKPLHFIFNNLQKEKRNKWNEPFLKSVWEMRERNMNDFLKLLEENNRKSVEMTSDVLKEPKKLEARFFNLMDRINEKELKTEELNQIQKILRQNRDKIERCENFQLKVDKVFTVKVAIESTSLMDRNGNATCCSVCKENCHQFGCWWVPPSELSGCDVMKNNHCTVCSGKCHYSKHIKDNKKYENITKTVNMTLDDLKQEFECTGEKPKFSLHENKYEDTGKEDERSLKESENETEIEKKLIRALEKIKIEKSFLLHEAYLTTMKLSEIPLTKDSVVTPEHLDFLILRLMEENEDDERIDHLNNVRRDIEQQRNKLEKRTLLAAVGDLDLGGVVGAVGDGVVNTVGPMVGFLRHHLNF